jgi:hypothetical protein
LSANPTNRALYAVTTILPLPPIFHLTPILHYSIFRYRSATKGEAKWSRE